MKKILITRRLLRSCEDKAKETFEANFNLNDERVEALYNIIDLAGDGRIKFNEFKMFISASDVQISKSVKARGSGLRSLNAPKKTGRVRRKKRHTTGSETATMF